MTPTASGRQGSFERPFTGHFFDLRLDALQAVVLLAEELNFNRAARRVPISQPAFSRRIVAAEIVLGRQLFERTSRSVSLTPAGEAALPLMRRLLETAGDLMRTVRQDRGLGHVSEDVR